MLPIKGDTWLSLLQYVLVLKLTLNLRYILHISLALFKQKVLLNKVVIIIEKENQLKNLSIYLGRFTQLWG